jgi:hypothetical protein
MAFEQRDNSGVLFKNDRKEKDNHPDYTGNAMIDGREYWISAWLKDGQKGKFFSFAFKPKDDKPQQQGVTMSPRAVAAATRPPAVKRQDPISTGRGRNEDLDDSIPFAPEFR